MQFNSRDYLNQTLLCMTLSKSSISSQGICIFKNTMDFRGEEKALEKKSKLGNRVWEYKYNLKEYAITMLHHGQKTLMQNGRHFTSTLNSI